MLFGLNRSPSSSMSFLNQDLHALLGYFTFACIISHFFYFDNIHYNKSLNNHAKHQRLVLKAFKKEQLFEEMVKVIQYWPTSKLLSEVRNFNVLRSFYGYFIPCYVMDNTIHTDLIFREIKRIHTFFMTFDLKKVNKFLAYFCKIVWNMLEVNLFSSISCYSQLVVYHLLSFPIQLFLLPFNFCILLLHMHLFH